MHNKKLSVIHVLLVIVCIFLFASNLLTLNKLNNSVAKNSTDTEGSYVTNSVMPTIISASPSPSIELPHITSILDEDKDNITRQRTIYLSGYISETTKRECINLIYYYDMTDLFQQAINDTSINCIVVDVNCIIEKKININRGSIDIYSNNKSKLMFKNGEGFYIDEQKVDDVTIHDLTISGYEKSSDGYLLYLSVDGWNNYFYNLNLESANNGIFVNGYVVRFYNIRISWMEGIGLYIKRSDNLFDLFYINGCKKQAVIIESTSNKISNFKILSSGYDCESVLFNKAKRNFITNFEIQDIYTKGLRCVDSYQNIMGINIDGIRTRIVSDEPVELASFYGSCGNIISMIATKYGNLSNEKYDYIRFDAYSFDNSVTATLKNVNLIGNKNNEINIVGRERFLSEENQIFPQLSYVGCNKDLDAFGYVTNDVNWGGIRLTHFFEDYPNVSKILITMIVEVEEAQYHVAIGKENDRYVRYLEKDIPMRFTTIMDTADGNVISLCPIQNCHVRICNLEIFDISDDFSSFEYIIKEK